MTREDRTYYDVLGVSRDSDAKSIRQAYLRASLNYHPDKNPGNEAAAQAKFIEIGEAYSVLGDPLKKAAYDRELEKGRRIPRQSRTNGAKDAHDFSHFMDMFDETVAGMSEQEVEMAMGAAAAVGSVIGSILGARTGKGNSLLTSAASMMGSLMASQAASTLVKSVHEDSTQRVIERQQRAEAVARGEPVQQPTAADSRERLFHDALGAFQKMAGAAMSAPSTAVNSNAGPNEASHQTNQSNGTNRGRMSWNQAAAFATMAAGAVGEMQRASNQQNSQGKRNRY